MKFSEKYLIRSSPAWWGWVSAALRRDAASWQTLCDGLPWRRLWRIMACGVTSYGWGASGLLGIPMMGAGPGGTKGMLLYCVGLAISCVMGFVLTFFTVPAERVKDV